MDFKTAYLNVVNAKDEDEQAEAVSALLKPLPKDRYGDFHSNFPLTGRALADYLRDAYKGIFKTVPTLIFTADWDTLPKDYFDGAADHVHDPPGD